MPEYLDWPEYVGGYPPQPRFECWWDIDEQLSQGWQVTLTPVAPGVVQPLDWYVERFADSAGYTRVYNIAASLLVKDLAAPIKESLAAFIERVSDAL